MDTTGTLCSVDYPMAWNRTDKLFYNIRKKYEEVFKAHQMERQI
jgi:hypothetical protein